MNYELAKQLKNTGFPVKKWPTDDLLEKCDFLAPTLSELIEACGEGFFMLVAPHRNPIGKWQTIGTNMDTHGTTPEEAVANLYLALHAKTRS